MLLPQSCAGLPPIGTWHQWYCLSLDVFLHRCFTTVAREACLNTGCREMIVLFTASLHVNPTGWFRGVWWPQGNFLLLLCLIFLVCFSFHFLFAQMIGRTRHCRPGHCSTPHKAHQFPPGPLLFFSFFKLQP